MKREESASKIEPTGKFKSPRSDAICSRNSERNGHQTESATKISSIGNTREISNTIHLTVLAPEETKN